MIASKTFLETITVLLCMECRNTLKRQRIECRSFFFPGGCDIIPVNPRADMILSRRCYYALKEVEGRIDIIQVLRPSEEAPGIVRQTVERKKGKRR